MHPMHPRLKGRMLQSLPRRQTRAKKLWVESRRRKRKSYMAIYFAPPRNVNLLHGSSSELLSQKLRALLPKPLWTGAGYSVVRWG